MSFWLIIGLIGCIIRASLPDSTRQSGRIQQLKTHLSLLSELYEISNYQSQTTQSATVHPQVSKQFTTTILYTYQHKLVSSSPLQYSIPTSCLVPLMVRLRPLWELVDVRLLQLCARALTGNSSYEPWVQFPATHHTWHVVYCWSL